MLAAATLVAAGLLVRFVCRRYSPRAAVIVAGGIVAAAALLPWLSFRSGHTAAQAPPRPLPSVSRAVLGHDLERGRVLHDAQLVADPLAPARVVTVFELEGGAWAQVHDASGLSATEKGRFQRHLVGEVPAWVAVRAIGGRGLALSYFITTEVLVTMAGTLVLASVASRPRRVNPDRWLAQAVAERHGQGMH